MQDQRFGSTWSLSVFEMKIPIQVGIILTTENNDLILFFPRL
jgi:hypothetical protein